MSDERKNAENKLKRDKIVYRKVVLPNLKKWFEFKETTYKDYNTEAKVQYAIFGAKDPLILVETEAGLSRKLWGIGHFIGKIEGIQIGQCQSLQSLARADYWSKDSFYKLMSYVQNIPEFKELKGTVDIDAVLKADEAKKSKAKDYSEKKRALKFTWTDQHYLAKVLVNLIISKTDNYLLKLMNDRISAQDADTSGEKLAEALNIYSLDRNDIINTLMSSDSETARRFAAMFAENSVVALVDKNKAVRIAAKARHAKKKEKEDDPGVAGVDQ